MPLNVTIRTGTLSLVALVAAASIAACSGAASNGPGAAQVVAASSLRAAQAGDEWPARSRRTPVLGKCLAVALEDERQGATSDPVQGQNACLGTSATMSAANPAP